MKFEKDKISRYIVLVPLAGVLITALFLTLAVIFAINNYFQEENKRITQKFMDDLKITTKQRVDIAYNILNNIYHNKMKYCKIHNISKKECDKMVIHEMQQIFDQLKWPYKGYVFVLDFKGNTLYHPNKKLMQINRWNLERNGVKVFQLLVHQAQEHPNGTYVSYKGYNPGGKPTEKVSYVKVFKPYDILIGSGVYLDYLDKRLIKKNKEREKVFQNLLDMIYAVIVIVSGAIVVIVLLISKQVRDMYEKYEKELQEEKEKFKERSIRDPLTGLYNRSYVLNTFNEIASRVKRNGKKAVIAFIDLDQFKEINDSLGHDYGDLLLIKIAQRIKKTVRKSDIVSRFGGDEFVLILDEVEKPENIISLIQRLLNNIKQKVILNDKEVSTTASIGLSVFPDDSEDINKLITYADTAMYEAKKRTGNSFEFYKKEMGEKAKEKLEIKNSLKEAIKKDELVVYFQPQIDKNGDLYGSEALVRWIHPKKGMIPPYKFISVATELGLIDKIDEIVLQKAIWQYKKWEASGYKPGIISCNFTMFDIERGNLIEKIKEIIKEEQFDPEKLIMEITEDNIMKNPDKAIKYVKELADLGIGIAIDDFGTGYSSLAYLNKFPVSELKIDREFIKDLPQNQDNDKIVKTVVNLAKNFNLKTVAEGVETKEQEKYVISLGIDVIQGYVYSPPVNAEEFEEKFLKGN
ncbi:sensor domain-containing phosphodiesterase [Caminibacter pacificus]|uniref:Diguanylate cyclase (GGDEF)-like protein n=1 Tax=Caminibacter pacificus TaxID=1424653 RepID=A0AAJ4RB49_9BACT|nr:sensor domain-containing phosphodiesterase [Caminibacter pacificus]NPA87176.1 EAL domain-containing protein [Campylobacterota bacterium]QCI29188.1 EAL domain-containing protein [Caminibacter pacificus]ROR38832.1 diguanylate cyclase (GGDEF)-like protein [Caminibacter pacificus]